jgi:hypothetical protein
LTWLVNVAAKGGERIHDEEKGHQEGGEEKEVVSDPGEERTG